MKKYIPAAILAVLLVFLCSASMVPGSGPYFADVEANDPNYPYIVELAQTGVMMGRGDGTFGADDPVSRRDAMEQMLRVIGAGDEPLETAAIEHKLVYTFETETLNDPVTRLEAAQMAARALDLLPMAGESPYADCDDGYVVKLWEKEIWDGGEAFRPEESLTRGELAGLLWHMARADVSVEAFRYSNYWVEILDGVPEYGYDPAGFALSEVGVDYIGSGYTVLRGVDVSGFQGDIDWERVKADGIGFAMIRVGGRFINSGKLYDDSYFHGNVKGALAAGLQVGVYYFSQAVNAQEGVEEAEYVLSCLEGYDITLPVVIDWEYLDGSDARTYGVEPAEVTAAVKAFCDRIREAGYEPMVYLNSYCGYIKMDLRELADVKFWYAQYSAYPAFAYHFDMWQYTAQGKVDGIEGEVDMNLYFVPET